MKEWRSTIRWTWLGPLLLPLLTLALVFGGGAATVAQDEASPEAQPQDTPPALTAEEAGRPAHIHSGTCEGGGVGPIVQALNNVVAPEGDAEGQRLAVNAESSFTSVPLALDDILDVDHVVNVHFSGEDFDFYIACGEIGGVRDDAGNLAIALKEANNSGFAGVAYLSEGEDGVSTDVTVFLVEGLTTIDTDTSPAASPIAVQATEEAEEEGDENEAEEALDATQEAEIEEAEETAEAGADEAEAEGEDDATPTS